MFMSYPAPTTPPSRREWLARLGKTMLVSPLLNTAWLNMAWLNMTMIGMSCGGSKSNNSGQPPPSDDQFLDEIQRAILLYVWEQASSITGQVKDRALARGNDTRTVSSIAATGFGLTALCIADQRGYMASANVIARVQATLTFLRNQMPHQNGFFYHSVDMNTGQRANNSEVSSIDTALLLCGVLTCRQHFEDQEIRSLAAQIYERVDWPWMLNGGKTLSHGWKPETGFLKARWDTYNELMMIYLLGLGSVTHPLPAETWDAWKRPLFEYDGIRYIGARAPLFVHQYSHAWFDF